MTLLEDDSRLIVGLEIYNTAPTHENINRIYPKGGKVVVKEPPFDLKRNLRSMFPRENSKEKVISGGCHRWN
jgi:hypothetical protein